MTRLLQKINLPVLAKSISVVLILVAIAGYATFKRLTTEDLTKGESPICELHKVTMERKLVTIQYGYVSFPRTDPEYFAIGNSFPHATPDHVNGGCVVRGDQTIFGPKTHARIFSCPQCDANQREWMKWLRKGCCRLVAMPMSQQHLKPDSLTPGPILHPKLSPSLIARIESLRTQLNEVYPLSKAEWINAFERYHDPEGDMAMWWEWLASGYADYQSRTHLNSEQRKTAFNVFWKLGLNATADDIAADLANLPNSAVNELLAEVPRKISDELGPHMLTLDEHKIKIAYYGWKWSNVATKQKQGVWIWSDRQGNVSIRVTADPSPRSPDAVADLAITKALHPAVLVREKRTVNDREMCFMKLKTGAKESESLS
jgi:hypothetical protein